MKLLRATRLTIGILLLAGALPAAMGCGTKGKPVPPERRIPQAPSQLKAEVTPSGVRLSCQVPGRYTDGSPLKDLEAIEIWRSDKGLPDCPSCSAKRRKIGEVPYVYPEGSEIPSGIVEYVDQGLKPGTYVYRVTARTKLGIQGTPSKPAEIYWDVPPRAVAGLRAQAGDRVVELAWEPVNERSDGQPLPEVAYQIFRGERGKGLGSTPLNASPIREPRFRDTSVQNNLRYEYRLRALRPVGDKWVASTLSEVVEATPRDLVPPAPPEGLLALHTPKAIRLIWKAGEEADIKGYGVYRAEGPDGPWKRLNAEPVPTVVFEDASGEPGKWYWYAVTALDNASPSNESQMSRPVKVRFVLRPP